MDRLEVGQIEDVNVNILIGGQFDNLLFGLFGAVRVATDKMNDPATLGDFNRGLDMS